MKPHALTLAAMAVLMLIWTTFAKANSKQPMRFDRLLSSDISGDIGPILSIAQDQMGFIWLGTENGLSRFDSHDIRRYFAQDNSPRALASNYINDLLVDKSGNLWIASNNGLNRYHSETDDFSTYFPYPNAELAKNRVSDIAIGADGNLALATDVGIALFDTVNAHFTHYPLPPNATVQDVRIETILIDSKNQIWIGTQGWGAARFDIASEEYEFFYHEADNSSSIVDNHITNIVEDHQGRLWFGSYNKGVARLNPDTQYFERFQHNPNNPETIGSNTIWDIHVDSAQQIWFATDPAGLALYNEQTGYFEHFVHNPYDTASIGSNKVREIFEDTAGDLWVGLFPSGLNYINRSLEQFQNFSHLPNNDNSLSHDAVLSLLEDSHGDIWIGTEFGLNQFDPDTQNFTRYFGTPGFQHSLRSDTILSLEEDRNGQLWIGTWSGGAHRYDRDTGRFYHYSTESDSPNTISGDFVWDILKDRQDRIWLGTQGKGLNLYLPDTDSFRKYQHDPNDPQSLGDDDIWTMIQDRDGFIWLGTSKGLNRLDPQSGNVARFNENSTLTGNFPKNARVRSLMQDQKGRLWVGTQDRGFYVLMPDQLQVLHFSDRVTLPSLYITGFVEDASGCVWITTTNGIVKTDPTTWAMTVFNRSHGLVGNNFNREANLLSRDGHIYVGSAEGFSIFDPAEIETSRRNFPIYFSGLSVMNEPITVGEDSLLKKSLWHSSKIVLDSDDKIFTLAFAALNYRGNGTTQYAYRLEGLNGDWVNLGHTNKATLSNLPSGKYTFHLKAGENGYWSENQKSLNIHILPPPWRTWWAYCVYAIILGTFIFLIIEIRVKQLDLVGERRVNQELSKLNEMKDAFLANTSHELRTPLNGIIGITDGLKEKLKGSNDEVAHRLDLIASSGRRLANLINDILDYSKLANRNLELNNQVIDLKEITEAVFALLAPLTSDNRIQLLHNFSSSSPKLWADENRLQQILINIIGNAIKYSHDAKVIVGFEQLQHQVKICVDDEGSGIPENMRRAIFEAFFQVENPNTRKQGGTGLGLAITKQLVELHGGSIWVEPRETLGSRFCFTMPLYTGTDDAQGIHTKNNDAVAANQVARVISFSHDLKIPRNAQDQTILVVDDDSVNRLVLTGILELHNYKVIEAAGGQEAIHIIENEPAIDLVFMDIMMPGMSGFEACEAIRKTHSMHQLPIIFLTAKRNIDADITNCFQCGGNDFLTKPVSKAELLPRVASHLRISNEVKKLQATLLSLSPQ